MIRSSVLSIGLAMFASSAVHGAVSSVAASPNSAQIDIARATHVTIGWLAAGTTGATIQSSQAIFRTANGKVLATINQPLSASLAAAGNASFVETVLVPETIAVRAHLTGEKKIFYQRSFSDGSGDVAASVTLHISASVGTGQRYSANPGASTKSFDLSRLTMAFEPNSPLASVRIKEPLVAKVKVGYSSTGILNASWQVAGPDPGEQPTFRKLADVSQVVDDSGEVVFRSPALPTGVSGMYLVRLEVTTPSPPFETPEIRYIVSGK